MNTRKSAHSAMVLATLGLCTLTIDADAATGPALGGVPPSEIVRFGDLNLSKPADVDKLYHRLSWTARRLCTEPSVLQSFAAIRNCYRDTMNRAIDEIGSARLAALNRVKLVHSSGG